LEETKQALLDIEANELSRQFAAGRIEALCDIEQFIKNNINPKLPHRLQKIMTQQNRDCSSGNQIVNF
jgi:hypothetical protein